MDPMFLPGVEADAKPSAYADAIRMMTDRGVEYPQIWHLFAYLPEATQHLARFTQATLSLATAALVSGAGDSG